MHRASPATDANQPSSSSSSSSSLSSTSHRYTRQQLLKSLEILGPLSTPMPPALPPSPPPSRSSSPAPGSKRKSESHTDHQPVKKPRTSSVSDSHRHPPSSSSHPVPGPSNYSSRSDLSEDGELREDLPAPRDVVACSNVPIRRPRRGRLPIQFYDELYLKYHGYGRMLKYSGDVRLLSTFHPKNSAFRPLVDPLPPQSSYHKYGNLIARLELVDSLVNFAYSMWAKDYSRSRCNRQNWTSIEMFLGHCKRKWQMEESADDREKALLGLIYMIEAFIHGRKFHYGAKILDPETKHYMEKLKQMYRLELQEREAAEAEKEANSMATPPMLPSPASITTSSSANSTPTGHMPGPSKPVQSSAEASSSTAAAASSSSAARYPPGGPERSDEPPPPSHLTLPINWYFLAPRKAESGGLLASAWCMDQSQRILTLPMMAKHFPKTFARMMYSTLTAHDEHEPDFEDEEGELFWPGQLITGQGLGWVCTMGKAMIKEFGKEFGYRGIDGVIQKPEMESADDEPIALSGVPLQGSTPVPFPVEVPSSVQR